MNGTYGVGDLLGAIDQQDQLLHQQIAIAENLVLQHRAQRDQLAASAQQALFELCEHLLPVLTLDHLQNLTRCAGFDHLLRADFLGARERERHQLGEWIRANDRDPRWLRKDNDRLVAESKVREAAGALQSIEQSIREMETWPRFVALIDAAFGTPEYAVPWWRISYYDHWKHADLCCAAAGVSSFDALRQRYLRESAAMATLREALHASQQAVTAIDQAVLAREHAAARLAQLDLIYLDEARRRLREHVRTTDRGLLWSWNRHDRVCEALVKRLAGVEAKLRYLDSLIAARIVEPVGTLRQALAKNAKDRAKYIRPKHYAARFAADTFQRRFRDRRVVLAKNWERYHQARLAIVGFDRYDAFEPASQVIWWDLMTDGRIDGDFIPEVREFHARYPSARRSTAHGRHDGIEDVFPEIAGRHDDHSAYDAS